MRRSFGSSVVICNAQVEEIVRVAEVLTHPLQWSVQRNLYTVSHDAERICSINKQLLRKKNS